MISTLVLVFAFMVSPFVSLAQFNQEINYQGKLTDSVGVAVADGDYNMNFWLLSSSTAATSTAIWSEARTGVNKVTVTNGLFSVMLGDVSSLGSVDFDQSLYLGVEIGGTGTPSWDGEMSPRKVLGAVPAAFIAENANTFDGFATTSFLRADDADTMEATSSSALLTLIQNGAGKILSLFAGATEMFTILNNGNVGIATTTPDSKLTVVGNSYFDGNVDTSGNLTVSGVTSLSGTTTLANDEYIENDTNGDIRLCGSGSTYNQCLNIGTDHQYFITLGQDTLNGSSAGILFNSALALNDNIDFTLGSQSTARFLYRNSGGYEAMVAETRVGGYLNTSGYFILGERNDNRIVSNNTDNPTFRVYSSDEGQVDDYIEFFHNQDDAVVGWGNGSLNFVNGTATTTISSAGNIGIGTTTPSSRLTVTGSTYLEGDLTVAGTSTFSDSLTMSGTAANIILGSNWLSGDGDDEGIYVNNVGDVSIGTTTDVAKFNVDGSIYIPNNYSFMTRDTSANNVSLLSMTSANNVLINGSTVSGSMILGVPNDSGVIQFEIGSTSNPVMKILNNGNIGIGTTTPSSKLTVAGDAFITGALFDSSNASGTLGQILSSTGTGTDWISTSTLGLGDGTFLGLSDTISSYTANRLLFANSGGTAVTDDADLVFDGTNLGIGTSTPQAKLDIGAGDLRFSIVDAPSTVTPSIALGGAGSLSGTYRYRVSYITATGETEVGKLSGQVSPSSQEINLTNIPVSSDPAVTGRKIYRNKDADGVWGAMYLVTTINDNSTTTYTDNIADGSLGVVNLTTQTTGGVITMNSASAMVINTTQTAVGIDALVNNISVNNSAFGYSALKLNTTGGYNNAFGINALNSNTTGGNNNAFGSSALAGNSAGSANSAFGTNSLSVTTGDDNTAYGAFTAQNISTGAKNVAVGSNAMRYVSSAASSNTAVGYHAGIGVLSNSYSNNSLFGSETGEALTTGSNNIFLGYRAGNIVTTGSNNILIGYDIDAASSTGSNQLSIGNLIFGTGIDGTGTSLSSGNIGIGSTTPSSKLTVTGNTYLDGNLTVSGTGSFAGNLTMSGTAANIALGSNFLSGDGDDEGIYVSSGGDVSIGTTTAVRKLTVDGHIFIPNNYSLATRDNAGSVKSLLSMSSANNVLIGGSDTSGSMNFILPNATGDFRFQTTGSYTDRLYIKNDGSIGIATTTPASRLTIENLNYADAGVAGIDRYLTFANSTASSTQYGDRSYLYATNTATSTLVGNFIKIEDATTFGNTVRGLEVQSDWGANTLGENTAMSGYARTFGVKGITSGDAGGSYEPAGVFGETTGTTQGNAIRGYSSSITTASLLKLFQDTSTFTGTGLLMNFGNSGGSFSSTTASKFVDLQNAGTSMFTVGAYGMLTIGDGTTSNNAGLQIGYGGLCVDNDGSCNASTTGRIASVSTHTGNSDLAETYFSSENLEAGEIVYTKGGLSVGRADTDTKNKIIGVVSTKPGLLLGYDDSSLEEGEEVFPIALSGRVPIKLSNENGSIKAGDELTLSSIPGVAMKATSTGKIIGVALEDFVETRAYSDTYINQFGDDLVDPIFEPINRVEDPRMHDGCYYGGGNATGEEECVPLEATTTDAQIKEAEALAEAEAERKALESLSRIKSDTEILENGQSVRVGQIVMFVDLGYRYLDDEGLKIIDSLLANASSTNGSKSDVTIWERLVNLANNFIDGVLSVFTLKADRVEVQNELCVDGVCVGADDLRVLLNRVSESPVNNTNNNIEKDREVINKSHEEPVQAQEDSTSPQTSANEVVEEDTDQEINEEKTVTTTTSTSTTDIEGDSEYQENIENDTEVDLELIVEDVGEVVKDDESENIDSESGEVAMSETEEENVEVVEEMVEDSSPSEVEVSELDETSP
ncbi:hypothetical protein H6777_00020 [Candidatus Nomurabacteria bacterium]|nr:hypothetical protein [Candidatus Nomurabacteria bacterium]